MKFLPSATLRTFGAALLLLIGLLQTGCESLNSGGYGAAGTEVIPVPATVPASPEISVDTLRVGDRIRLIYADIPTPPPAVDLIIPEDGKIGLHLGVEYNFLGKKKAEAEREIAAIYVEQRRFYQKLTIQIEKQSNSYISVEGEVRIPSSIVHRNDLTVLSAVAAAGGFTEFANRTKVVITRGATQQQITVNAKKAIDNPKLDTRLFPGDRVYVRRSIW